MAVSKALEGCLFINCAKLDKCKADGCLHPFRPPLRAQSQETLRLREALERIAVAAEFHAQSGVADDVRRYAHESTYRLARATLDHKGETKARGPWPTAEEETLTREAFMKDERKGLMS